MRVALQVPWSSLLVRGLRDDILLVEKAANRGVGHGQGSLFLIPKDVLCSLLALRQSTIRSCIILMLVKIPSNLLLQLELTSQVTHRSCVIKELPLDFSGKIIPLHDHGRAETPQHTLFSCVECQVWSEIRFWR